MDDPTKSRNSHDRIFKLLTPLTAFAANLFLKKGISARDDTLPATGKSPRGLAFDAITEFIEGGMKFRERSAETYEKDLFNFLRTAVLHDFLDLIKSHEYQKTQVIDAAKTGDGEESRLVLEDLGDRGSEDGFSSLETAMVARRVLALVEDEPELKELVEAVLYLEVTKREDIAYALGITPQEVTYRNNQLRNRLASWHRSVHASRKVVSTNG